MHIECLPLQLARVRVPTSRDKLLQRTVRETKKLLLTCVLTGYQLHQSSTAAAAAAAWQSPPAPPPPPTSSGLEIILNSFFFHEDFYQ